MPAQWFESWFDSRWYPILYHHRDYKEAEGFIEHLLQALSPASGAKFLDLACGRGRHSVFIHEQGHDVMGLDLSAASIADAKKSEGPGLQFAVHDMRSPLDRQFDFIFNLFTSFGYFEDQDDNDQVLENVAKSLLSGGTFVLDFFNVAWVLKQIVPFQEIELQGIHFTIRKRFEKGFIIKSIQLVDAGETFHFEERVQGLTLADFEGLFSKAGLEIEEIWGDYAGARFDAARSTRLILFARHAINQEVNPR